MLSKREPAKFRRVIASCGWAYSRLMWDPFGGTIIWMPYATCKPKLSRLLLAQNGGATWAAGRSGLQPFPETAEACMHLDRCFAAAGHPPVASVHSARTRPVAHSLPISQGRLAQFRLLTINSRRTSGLRLTSAGGYGLRSSLGQRVHKQAGKAALQKEPVRP